MSVDRVNVKRLERKARLAREKREAIVQNWTHQGDTNER